MLAELFHFARPPASSVLSMLLALAVIGTSSEWLARRYAVETVA
jgi:hypothetical protein